MARVRSAKFAIDEIASYLYTQSVFRRECLFNAIPPDPAGETGTAISRVEAYLR